ncbi:MAG: hypothetical protein M3Q69_12445 [Acidobacteriota bacterium]|nr:hypothetical protein [Acidobacteriota bacterium]
MFEDDPKTQLECEQLIRVITAIRAAATAGGNLSPDLLLYVMTERFRRILPVAGIPKENWKAVGTIVIVLCFLDDNALDRAAAASGSAPFIIELCQRANALYTQYPYDCPGTKQTSTADVLAIRRDIDALPETHRTLIRRRLGCDEPLATIAADMNLRFSYVAQTLLRFLARIRTYLDE